MKNGDMKFGPAHAEVIRECLFVVDSYSARLSDYVKKAKSSSNPLWKTDDHSLENMHFYASQIKLASDNITSTIKYLSLVMLYYIERTN